MIIDKITSMKSYECMHARFPEAFAFFEELMAKGAPDGKYGLPNKEQEVYVILGTNENISKPEAVAEAHKRYIDVQIVLSGTEMMYVPAGKCPALSTEYNEAKDVMFYEGVAFEDCYSLRVCEGEFAIFFAGELHAPAISVSKAPTTVRKAIIKVLA